MRLRRLLVVTSKQAYSLLREVVADAKRRWGIEIDVVALPVPSASSISTDNLVKLLPRLVPDYKRYDVIIVPGRSAVDPREASRKLGVMVVKGPLGAGDLPLVFDMMMKGDVREDYSSLSVELDGMVQRVFSKAKRLCVGGACIWFPPAYTLIVEVVPGGEFEELLDLVREAKPDFIVLGDMPDLDDDEVRRYLCMLSERIGSIPFGIETSRMTRMKLALDMGASLVSGVSASSLAEFTSYKDRAFFVLQPFDEQRGLYPRGVEEKLSLLARGIEVASKLGFEGVIVDPIVVPPPLGFVESLEPYRVINEWNRRFGGGYPLLFSLASIEDSLSVDALPVFLFAAGIGFELNASVYWVVAKRGFEPYEARTALNVIAVSLERKVLPADLHLDLTILGLGDRWVPDTRGAEVVEVGHVEPRQFDRGYARIGVRRGEIIVEYVDLKTGRRRVYRGKEGLSIARMIIHDFNVNPEHAAYLGYQLARAEMAAKLGVGFVQDEEYRPPFQRVG